MSYLVNEIMADYTDRSTGNRQIRAYIVADTAADLPANTTALTWLLGSYAKTVDTGDEYYINSSGSWILQPSSSAFSNVYTKAETDSLLADKQDILTSAQISAINTAAVGSKNMLDYTLTTLQSLNTAGTWSGNAYTRRGITFTVNADMSISVSGTNDGTGNSWFDLKSNNTYQDMYGSGCPAGGSSSTYRIQFGAGQYDTGSGCVTYTGGVGIVVYSGYDASGGLTFKPMISDSLSNDYEPYCPSIYELYQLVKSYHP